MPWTPSILLSAALASAPGTLSGTVRDATGAMVRDAEVSLLDPQRAVVAATRTDERGAFAFAGVRPGSYLVTARSTDLGLQRTPVSLRYEPVSVEITLLPAGRSEEVTVTAHPGLVEGTGTVSQPVNVISEAEIGQRAKSVVAQVADGEAGLFLQRTSPTMAGIFVRGLTGNKVNVFVDGQRYSTGAQRGGVNTFLDLIGPSTLEAVEVVRGPGSAQYGSDALGGSIQFLTRTPPLAAAGHELHGTYAASGSSADASLGGELTSTYATPSVGVLAALSGRRGNTLRAGGGTDSHNALRRFFGVDPEMVLDGGRLPDTAFTQYGGLLKLNWAPSPRDRLVASYTRSQQDGGKRYDQLLGGDGNLVADLRNLMLDRASLKYQRLELGPFDSLSLGYSYNAQREERVNQGGNGNPRAAINHEYEKTRVHGLQVTGVQVRGRHSVLVGGDLYRERITAPSFAFNPVSGAVTVRRGRVPDQARYLQGGVFAQDVWEVRPGRIRLVGNLRWSHAAYGQRVADGPVVGGQVLWPDDEQDFSSVTFRTGVVVTPGTTWTFTANVGRGFRAPHITDLGTVGLTGSGFEITPGALAGRGATIGSGAGADAVTTGRPADRLDPEKSLSYEASVRFRRARVSTDLVGFVNDIDGNIQKLALILPAGATGSLLGDQPITRQTPGGAVFVPLSASPVLVNANFDDVRIWGIEHTLEVRATDALRLSTAFTYLHAEDRNTHRPPNIEGGTPPADAWLTVRYGPSGARYWGSRTSIWPDARSGCPASTWKTGGRGPAGRAPASPASSTTARGPAASWATGPTARPARRTTSSW
jgi:outer membrane receptor for ferrienterochelin and colicin